MIYDALNHPAVPTFLLYQNSINLIDTNYPNAPSQNVSQNGHAKVSVAASKMPFVAVNVVFVRGIM